MKVLVHFSPIVSFMALMVIWIFMLLPKLVCLSFITTNLLLNGWRYRYPCPMEFWAPISRNQSSIPIFSAFSRISMTVKLFSISKRIISRNQVQEESQEFRNSVQRLSADLSLIYIWFWKPFSVSTISSSRCIDDAILHITWSRGIDDLNLKVVTASSKHFSQLSAIVCICCIFIAYFDWVSTFK